MPNNLKINVLSDDVQSDNSTLNYDGDKTKMMHPLEWNSYSCHGNIYYKINKILVFFMFEKKSGTFLTIMFYGWSALDPK